MTYQHDSLKLENSNKFAYLEGLNTITSVSGPCAPNQMEA